MLPRECLEVRYKVKRHQQRDSLRALKSKKLIVAQAFLFSCWKVSENTIFFMP